MNTQNARSLSALIPLVMLAVAVGCSRQKPVGQFDDGSYEVRDSNHAIIAELYAHHAANNSESFEIWAVDEKACPKASASCALGRATYHYKTSFKSVGEWSADWEKRHADGRSSARFFRATYDTSAAGALACTDRGCSLSPRGRTTPISMFGPGLYRTSGDAPAYIVVDSASGGLSETWFMERFLNSEMPTSGVSLSTMNGMDAETTRVANSTPVKVDVQYKECKALPSTDRECAQ